MVGKDFTRNHENRRIYFANSFHANRIEKRPIWGLWFRYYTWGQSETVAFGGESLASLQWKSELADKNAEFHGGAAVYDCVGARVVWY